MGCVPPGAEEARNEGAEDERALPDDMGSTERGRGQEEHEEGTQGARALERQR